MAADKLRVNIFDMVVSIARVIDMMSPVVGNHHMQVAYLAYRLGEQLQLSADQKYELFLAGSLHDIGAFSLQDRLDLLEFEDTKPGEHSVAGSFILETFTPFSSIARLIKFHHVHWKNGEGAFQNGESVPNGSHIIHLADRVAVKISRKAPVLSQVRDICREISEHKGDVFVPEYVDALINMANREHIWLDIMSGSMEEILKRTVLYRTKELTIEEMVDFSRLPRWPLSCQDCRGFQNMNDGLLKLPLICMISASLPSLLKFLINRTSLPITNGLLCVLMFIIRIGFSNLLKCSESQVPGGHYIKNGSMVRDILLG